jgi:hypothetical protein
MLNTPGGRCYDHNFLRFSTIFGKKLLFFSKTNVMIEFFQKLAVVWGKNPQYFRWIFRRKYFKNHNIGPGIDFFKTPFWPETLQIKFHTKVSNKFPPKNNSHKLSEHYGKYYGIFKYLKAMKGHNFKIKMTQCGFTHKSWPKWFHKIDSRYYVI